MARTVSIDAEVDLRTVNDSLLQEMEMLEPCGMAMRRPLFLSRSARLEGPPRRFGNGHLRMNILRDGGLPLDAVAFRMSDRSIYPEMDLVFELEWNRWGGRAKPRMLLRDFRPNDSPFGINGLFDEGEPE